MDNFIIEKIHPKIWVFKKAFSHSIEMYKYFEENSVEKWQSWYNFGTHVSIPTPNKTFDKFPTEDEWNESIVSKVADNIYLKEFTELFYKTTKQYCEELNIEQVNWHFDRGDIAKYDANAGVDTVRAMNYHTDYQKEKELEPGNKFETTCLFYLNDDYDGGEICFKIFNDDYSQVIERIEYKPSAGDIVIFPAKAPFYHAVKIAERGAKYIIRTYWRYVYEGHPDYFKEKEKYTEEEFKKITEEKYQKVFAEIGRRVQMDTNNDPFKK